MRKEKDSIGEIEVEKDALFGAQSVRGRNNFYITGERIDKTFIKSLGQFKKAAVLANNNAGLIEDKIKDAMVKACDEIIDGSLDIEFITDTIQGGAGTSINMNVNEVIANRAAELLGSSKGTYDVVHPNDHSNMGQSTNDVMPTSGKLTCIYLGHELMDEIKALQHGLNKKAEEFKDVIKLGRTHLQDAVPVKMGQEFKAWANSLDRDIKRLELAISEMKVVNFGATAIGTGINANEKYFNNVVKYLNQVTGMKDLEQGKDLIDGTRHTDSFAFMSSVCKTLAINLSKNCNDLRMMASGPLAGFAEINLPAKQPGSSIMPGKVNPVIPEVVNQTCFQVIGNDNAITFAAEGGQFELNVFEPVLFRNLFQSLRFLTNAINTLRINAIHDLTANKERCKTVLDNSLGSVTALAPHIGYANASMVAKTALKEGKSVNEVVLEKKLLSEADLLKITDTDQMTTPGICAQELLK